MIISLVKQCLKVCLVKHLGPLFTGATKRKLDTPDADHDLMVEDPITSNEDEHIPFQLTRFPDTMSFDTNDDCEIDSDCYSHGEEEVFGKLNTSNCCF